jgi:hypothetical protein
MEGVKKLRKLMLLAVMLAMVLAITVPAAAQAINTGNFASQQGTSSYDSTGDFESEDGVSAQEVSSQDTSGQDALSQDASCYDLLVGQIANSLGITLAEAAELVGFATSEELDRLAAEFCS